MNDRRASTRILKLGYHNGHLAVLYPATIETLTARAATIDGWTPGNDNPKVSHTSELTPTEAAAEARLHHTRTIADIEAGVALLEATYRDLINTCQRAIAGTHSIPAVQLCESLGREGAHEWGGACDRPVDKDGLCTAHYHAERRWRKVHNLPTRKSIQPAGSAANPDSWPTHSGDGSRSK